MILVAGRYEGMDARVEEEYADLVISIGDFVLMGGDIPAMVLLEGLLRLFRGLLARRIMEHDSFSGPFVDYPEYTAPVVWHGKTVPEVLRSGNHAQIEKWRTKEAVNRTLENHFEWVRSYPLNDEQKKELRTAIPGHYVALLHNDIIVGDGDRIGCTSVTSLDIHDIARSAKTYGIVNYFIVTQLLDQQKIVRKLLDFWQHGGGVEYNLSRHEAVAQVELMATLEDAIEAITRKEGVKPLLIATSARAVDSVPSLTFHEQGKAWAHKRPILLLFGTGRGIALNVLERCDYLLVPVEGMTGYNHLSVRSATAIILDRWLGLSKK